MRKIEVFLNKPIYIGLTVLDVSKTLMYEFHYDYMRRIYKDKCKLTYTDTDSFIYMVKCEDFYKDMKSNIQHFDTSDYPLDNVYGMPRKNKKVVGLFKDESCGKLMTEFCGLRSKMYSIRIEGKDDTKKIKGVKASVVKKTITFEDYQDCLKNLNIKKRTQYIIRSKLHQLETVRQTKIALNPYDDKRYLLPHNIETLAWGHYKINKKVSNNVLFLYLKCINLLSILFSLMFLSQSSQ